MAVSLLTVFSTLGGVAALFVASIVTSNGFNWRYAFFFGLAIALVGGIARTRLRETPDFVNAKRELERTLEIANIDKNKLQDNTIVNKKVNIKTSISYFLIQCTWPVYSYVAFIHCGSILKSTFGYSPAQIIDQNLIAALLGLLSTFVLTYLCDKMYPLKILKNQLIMLVIFIIASPTIFQNISTPFHIILIQTFFICIAPTDIPATPVFFRHFPILHILLDFGQNDLPWRLA